MPQDDSQQSPAPQSFTRKDGATIAYHALKGKSPGVIFLHGLHSDMEGGKALATEAFCQARGNAFLRLDMFGHGLSSGAFTDGCLSRWADDVLDLLDNVTEGPQVLVGSSMGGWVALLVARARPERIAGLVGIAAAPDFTEDLMWPHLTPAQQKEVMENGLALLENDYSDEPYRIAKLLIEDGRENLVLRAPLAIECPIRLLHGVEDKDVPWTTALKIQDQVSSQDVETTLIKAGDHRLSEPQDIARLEVTLDRLLSQVGGKSHVFGI